MTLKKDEHGALSFDYFYNNYFNSFLIIKHLAAILRTNLWHSPEGEGIFPEYPVSMMTIEWEVGVLCRPYF